MLKRLIRLWPFHNLRITYIHDVMLISVGRGSPLMLDNYAAGLLVWNYWIWKDSQRPGVQAVYKKWREAMDKIAEPMPEWWKDAKENN